MGIDQKSHSGKEAHKDRKVTSPDLYLHLLIKLYKFLARRTASNFNKVIAKRLKASRVNKCPLSLRHIAKYLKDKQDKTVVIVGSVLDDARLEVVPRFQLCALHVSESARTRILAAGGSIITFDQLAQQNPLGQGVVLLRGKRTARKAYKHFGSAPGVPGSKARPYIQTKGRKFERARGRRKSRGYKV